ncbi:MAG TPA: restriction endonuclease subunit S [Fimbriimonadaceae bacterium]|nr:restriction endonuclease subunit S [Fimbriimonadaceae bacterium]
MAEIVNERVGDAECVPYTVTSGTGLVTQGEKYGRTIAGKSLVNYIRLRKEDFAYNKSATKAYPEGYIARFRGDDQAAVPNSIFTCFRISVGGVDPAFLDFQFAGNLHGRWLRRLLTVGARAHGSLNVSDDDLMALPVPIPAGPSSDAEQRKIAECLTSLDELIAAEGRKLEALRTHKKGLMQNLFPREGEPTPRLRFPEFHTAGEWGRKPIGDLFDTTSGGTPDRRKPEYWGLPIPWITTSLVDFNVIHRADEHITHAGLKNSAAVLFPPGTVLIAMYGQGKTRGKVALLATEAATNQACAAILPSATIDVNYTFLSLCGRYDELRRLSNSGGQENLSQALVRNLLFAYPTDLKEQQRIASCLGSLDTLITAQTKKLDTLKTHKQGLMQGLFPLTEGE